VRGTTSNPSGWAYPRIEEVCSIVAGYGFPNELQGKQEGDFPFYKVGDISEAWQRNERFLSLAKHYLTVADAIAIRARPLPPRAVVFAKIGAAISLNRRALLSRPSLVDNNCMGLIGFHEALDSIYLFYFMNTVRLGDSSRASIVPSLRKGDVGTIRLPLPPLPEQRRIVAKIEELFSDLDAGVAYLTRVRSNLKRYRAAVLKAAVEGRLTENWRAKHSDTEPAPVLLDRILTERRRKWEEDQLAKFAQSRKQPPKDWREKYREPYSDGNATRADLPPTWCWVSMDQLLGFLRNGLPQKPTGPPSGHRILRINAVRPMKVDLDEVRYFEDLPAEAESYWIEEGDLLFTRYNGSVELLGVSGLVRGCDQPTLHPDKLIRVKTVLNGPLPFFAEIASNVGKSRKHMERRARTTAGQTGISGTDIREMPVPLPPLDEQKQIIIEVERHLSLVDKIEAQVEANLKRASRLRQGILKRAFEGRLVPQDPNDEPAEQHLARIRDQRQSSPPSTNGNSPSRRPGSPRKSRSATPLFDQDDDGDQGGEP
jgi:type I restriction enzyme S subunit